MIFTELVYGIYGYKFAELYLICMRIDEVTVAGTYWYGHISSNLSTGDTDRAQFRLFYYLGR